MRSEVDAKLDQPLREAMLTQRAIRRLRSDPVDDEILLKIIEMALHAPSAFNRQGWEFIVVRDALIKAQFGAWYGEAWKLFYERIGRRAAARDARVAKNFETVVWQIENFSNLPVLIVPCLRVIPNHLIPEDFRRVAESSHFGSIYPAVQNLLLAARALGLGACLVTAPLWKGDDARNLLRLPPHVEPCCVIPVGWPLGRYGTSARRPVETVTHLDTFGRQPWKAALA